MEGAPERRHPRGTPGAAAIGASPRLAGGIGGALFIGGASIAIAAVLRPHPLTRDTTGDRYLALGEVALGLILLWWAGSGASSRRWIPAATIAGAIAAVTVSIYLDGERDGGPAMISEVFYVWPAIYAGYFLRPRVAVLVVSAVAVAYVGIELVNGIEASTIVPRTLVLISVVGGTAAVAHALRLYVTALVEKLDGLARTDTLTSLTNRRGFDERLDEELRRHRRTEDPVALLLGDIDRFKDINDHFGHAAGDEVLRELGRVMTHSARSIDTAARIGGEEFALVLPSTDQADAVVAAERLRLAVSAIRDPGGGPVRMSFGVASTESDRCFDSDSLLSAADQALYTAKAEGRNRTVAFDGSTPAAVSK